MKERMLATIKARSPKVYAKLDPATITDDELEARYAEALALPEPAPADGERRLAEALERAATQIEERTAERLAMIELRATARATIAAAAMPQAARDRLIESFNARASFTAEDVSAAIKAEGEYLTRLTEAGRVRLPGFPGIEVEDRSERMARMLDAFFDSKHKDHARTQSFRECYVELTGDARVSGRLDQCDRARLSESLGVMREALDSTSFSNVLGSAITRRVVADYREMGQYDVWRAIASPVPVNDFRSNERTRFGGYGDLPAVNQSSAYQALTSPTDEKATYSVTKRGGTESVTLEMIRNDDVSAIQRIPVRMSRSSKRTLAKFVLDFIRTNPTLYDSVAFFHASHGNLGSSALDATTLAAGRVAMLKQTELSSADRIGIGPKYTLVPVDLQETAFNLFARSTNNDKTFVQEMMLTVVPVWYWTDTNDWALAADPSDIPGIEIGFLDGNQEPEIFVQDNPSVGSLFSNDQVTYKIRHIYGGNVVDYRGFYKAVVA